MILSMGGSTALSPLGRSLPLPLTASLLHFAGALPLALALLPLPRRRHMHQSCPMVLPIRSIGGTAE